MFKPNIYALFGMLFISSALLVSGTYISNQTSILAQENESEVKTDIKEQENRCTKETECENENKINNHLAVTTSTQTQAQPEPSPCEDCFTSILSLEKIDDFLTAFSNEVEQEISTLEELCHYIDENQGTIEFNIVLIQVAEDSQIDVEQYIALIKCLQDAGFDVDFAF